VRVVRANPLQVGVDDLVGVLFELPVTVEGPARSLEFGGVPAT